MAFNFGSSATGSGLNFGFGTSSTAPASTAFNFGSNTGSALSFGSSAMGSGFNFGANTAGTSSGFNLGFGASAPATTSGFNFGSGLGGGSSSNAFAFNFGSSASGGLGGNTGNTSWSWGQPLGTSTQATASSAPQPDKKIQAIIQAYNPQNPSCRFQFMFYNKVTEQEARMFQRPANVDPQLWAQAVRNNPDDKHLVPCLATGFEDLQRRYQEQEKTLQVYQQQLQAVQRVVMDMKHSHEVTSKVDIAECRKRHLELSHRLLRVMHSLQLSLTRDVPLKNEEMELRKKLAALKTELSKPNQYQARVAELATMVRMQEERPADVSFAAVDMQAQAETMTKIYQILDMQRKALGHITKVLKKDLRDADIAGRGLQEFNTAVSSAAETAKSGGATSSQEPLGAPAATTAQSGLTFGSPAPGTGQFGLSSSPPINYFTPQATFSLRSGRR